MSPYLDVVMIPVPRAKLEVYKQMSERVGQGASAPWRNVFSDAVGDDVQPGKLTSFPQAVQLKDGEVVAVSGVVYKSREDRDRIAAAVREDPELKAQMDPSKMPFDGQRMFWGDFQTIVGLSPGH